MTDWVRLWHDMPTDPKWRVIARKSGQPLPAVIAVFAMMMCNASGNAEERGVLIAWDDEDAGAALDMDGEAISAIRAAMQGKVIDGQHLTGWERRQPKREDNSVGRVKAYRDRKRAECNDVERPETPVKRTVTHCNAPETDAETDTETEKKIRAPQPPKGVTLPDWVPVGPWDGYVRMRKGIRKPITADGVDIAITKLAELKAAGHDPGAVLRQSTFQSWQGLFEVKDAAKASAPVKVGL